jgi:TolA-binding protein
VKLDKVKVFEKVTSVALISIVSLVCFTVILSGCKKEAPPQARPPAEVSAIKIEPKDTPIVVEFVGQRRAQRIQAEENLKRMERRITVEIDKAYRKLEQTKNLIDVTGESLTLQKENLRLKSDGRKAGTATEAQYATAIASVKKAEYEELQAILGYSLAVADLKPIIGPNANL